MSSADVVPPFVRCGNTPFWRPEGQTNDDLNVIFVDPVGMVVVQSIQDPGTGNILLLRGWFDEPYEGIFMAIHEALPEDESVPLNLWLRTILAAVRTSKKNKIVRLFAAMVPEAQRKIISGIIHWLTRVPRGWKGDNQAVDSDVGAVWEALGSFDIHEC